MRETYTTRKRGPVKLTVFPWTHVPRSYTLHLGPVVVSWSGRGAHPAHTVIEAGQATVVIPRRGFDRDGEWTAYITVRERER